MSTRWAVVVAMYLVAGCTSELREVPSSSFASASSGVGVGVADIAPSPSGQYSLLVARTAVESPGRCVEGFGAVADCSGDLSQGFELRPTAGSAHRLVNRATQLCLDIEGASRADGARLVQQSCSGSASQLFETLSAAPFYALRNQNSGKCLEFSSGAEVHQTGCTGAVDQKFALIVTGVAEGVYQVVGRGAQKCLGVSNGATGDGVPIEQRTCVASSADQRVRLDASGSFQRAVFQHSGQCLDVPGNSAASGVLVQQWTCNGLPPQRFRLAQTGGAFLVVHEGTAGCLDLPGFSTAEGARVQQWQCGAAQANQLFSLRRLEVTPLFDGLPGSPTVDAVFSFDSGQCSSPMLEYDCAYPSKEWNGWVRELFVVGGGTVCLKPALADERYRVMTLAAARRASIACIPTDTSNRVTIPRSTLTYNGLFLEGDPAVFSDGRHVYLSGTAATPSDWATTVPIFEANADGRFDFKYKTTYDPSAFDPVFDYCDVYGQFTDFEPSTGRYVFTINAFRVPKGQACHWVDASGRRHNDNDVISTMFYVTAWQDAAGHFQTQGAPRAFNASLGSGQTLVTTTPGGPVSTQAWGDPGGGLNKAIHLDGNIYRAVNGERWFSWVWFDAGNHIASTRLRPDFSFGSSAESAPIWQDTNVVLNTDPVDCEEGINEGSTFFERNDSAYLVYTHGEVTGCYGMNAVRAPTVGALIRGRAPVQPLFDSFPCNCYQGRGLRNPGLREIAGSGHGVKVGSEYYQFYGVGQFDKAGHYLRRDVTYSKLQFRSDGSVVPLKRRPVLANGLNDLPPAVDLSWPRTPGYEYALELRVHGATHFPHPLSPADSGSCGLNSYDLRNGSPMTLSSCWFDCTTDPSKSGWLNLAVLSGFDGMTLHAAQGGQWSNGAARRAITLAYNKTARQFIPFDPTVTAPISVQWTDLGAYEYHLGVQVGGADTFVHPDHADLGLGFCSLDAGVLHYANRLDLSGCFFVPQSGAPAVWAPISRLAVSGLSVSYAWHGNWELGSLRGERRINGLQSGLNLISLSEP